MDRGNDHRNSMPPSGPQGAIEEVYNKYASLSTNPSKKKKIYSCTCICGLQYPMEWGDSGHFL